MKASRLTAVGLVAAAGLWIASGHLLPHEKAESRAPARASAAKQPFRVAVATTTVVPHSRKLVIAGRTEADKRVTVTARTGGVLTELKVKRGMSVKKDEVIAVLSDEARVAQVAQAQAVVTQKRTELEAKRPLMMSGTLPRLQLVDLEAQLKAAEAALAGAEAEQERGVVRAPWSGVVHDVAVEVGQAAFSFAGREIASLVALDPMLAVVEVAERQLAGIKVGALAEVRLVTGERASGKIRFVAKTASPTTRT
jgi:membrane fusion protein, multidrug efflux system